MQNKTEDKNQNVPQSPASLSTLLAGVIIMEFVIMGVVLYNKTNFNNNASITDSANNAPASEDAFSADEELVLPSEGIALPAVWGDLGKKLVDAGAIDTDKFKALYQQRDGFPKEYQDLLFGGDNGQLKITRENAGYLLNLFWALGLANKNPILDTGEMSDSAYGGAGNFASTGGWTVAKGDAMDHYSRHEFIALTNEQQRLVDKISRGIYRPCCGNSTHFPDCNHGMAMLGLLELMASQGAGEQEMYNAALAVNAYWFPQNYLTIAQYMKQNGAAWQNVSPQEILGFNFSSASGYSKIASQVSQPKKGGNSCGV